MDLGSIFNAAVTYGLPLIALGSVALGSLYTIAQEHVGLVTRFGKHVRTNEEAGLKFKIPFIESVKEISMQEYQVDEELETKTTDNLFVKLPIAIHYQVSDAATFHFKKGNGVQLMKKVVAAAVREYTSKKDFQELYDERQEIKAGVLEKVEEQVAGFGLTINDIVIDEPAASDQVKKTFDRVRSSALEKDAAQNEADAEFIRKVRSAEADKARDILRGEGAAGYRQKIFDQYGEQMEDLVSKGVSREEAVRVMMKVMEFDTWREVGTEGKNMVIVTGDSENSRQLANMQTLTRTMGTPSPEQDTGPRKQPPPAAEPMGPMPG